MKSALAFSQKIKRHVDKLSSAVTMIGSTGLQEEPYDRRHNYQKHLFLKFCVDASIVRRKFKSIRLIIRRKIKL